MKPSDIQPAFELTEWVLLSAVAIMCAFVAMIFGVPPVIAVIIPAGVVLAIALWQSLHRRAPPKA